MQTRPLPLSKNAGSEYLQAQSIDQRRANGRVYTPPYIVQFVLRQAGYTAGLDIETRPILDPACGAGAFLEQIVHTLFQRLQVLGRGNYENLVDAIEANVWGIDADERACAITTNVIRFTVKALTGRLPSAEFLRRNICKADFLLNSEIDRLAPIANGRLAFLVGNPPYVSATRIDADYKNHLRQAFHSATGRIDLYGLFVERAVSLLPAGSRLALITPDKFLSSYSGQHLRALIAQTSAIRTLALFSSHTIFEDAAIVPCVTVLERSGRKGSVEVLACAYRPDRNEVQVLERREIEQSTLGASAWRLESHNVRELVAKLKGRHRALRDIALRISAGPATGRDNLFVLPRQSPTEIEPELLRPVVRGRDIDAYKVHDSELSILLPYVFDDTGSPRLIKLSDYPLAARYLRRHRDELSARHCVRVWDKAWYEFHDQPVVDLSKLRKILVPDVANSNRFAVDSGTYFPLHSAYYILPKNDIDLDYVVAVLNSAVASFLMRIEAPVVKDGFNRYRQQFLMTLPVPTPRKGLADAIVRAAQNGDAEAVDKIVGQLFDLTDKEVSLVQARISGRLAA